MTKYTRTPTHPPSLLIGSQLQTYNTLISMGFDASESVTLAQTFGPNVEGAVNCVCGEGISGFDLFGPNSHGNTSLFPIKEDIIEFRRTSVSETLMTGYIHNHDEPLNDDNIPTVIKDIIIRYFNLYFIKLNYNIYNHATVDEMDDKYVDNDCKMYNYESFDAIPSHCTLPILALKSNQTLREIAIRLEKSYTYSYQDAMDHYQYFIHLWLKFRLLKIIYPIKNTKMNITMHDINKHENAYDEDRWVEIPNDFEELKISDIDMLITRTNPNAVTVLELGIERFDEYSKRWPFRHKPYRSDVFSIGLRPLTQSVSSVVCIPSKNATYQCAILAQVQSTDDNAQKQTKIKYHVDDIMPVRDDMITHFGDLLTHRKFDLFIDISDCADSDDEFDDAYRVVERHRNCVIKHIWKCDSCGQMNDNKNTICVHCAIETIWKCVSCGQTNDDKNTMCVHCFMGRTLRPLSLSFDWIKYLKIGDIVDVKDKQDKWHESVIRYIQVDNIRTLLYIHYIGWKTKWDDCILLCAGDVHVSRIAIRNTRSRGTFRVKSKHSASPNKMYPNYKDELSSSQLQSITDFKWVVDHTNI